MRKLGKLPARHDHRVPRLASYLPKALPPPPESVDWFSKIAYWPMFKNDERGDCAFAAIGHMRQQATAYASGTAQIATDEQILSWYGEVTGFNPNDPSTDKGTVLIDALAHWLNPGFAVGPATYERIAAYCYVDHNNTFQIQRALSWFGSLYIGINLPLAWQKPGPWDVGPAGTSGDWTPGSWGGHCVPLVGYDTRYAYSISWGRLQPISWAALHEYTDEMYLTLNEDWKKPPGFTPAGIPWTTLVADMDVIRNGG